MSQSRSMSPFPSRANEARRTLGAPAPRSPLELHERRMTASLRAAIGAGIAGLTLFFHAPLGAALALLLHPGQ